MFRNTTVKIIQEYIDVIDSPDPNRRSMLTCDCNGLEFNTQACLFIDLLLSFLCFFNDIDIFWVLWVLLNFTCLCLAASSIINLFPTRVTYLLAFWNWTKRFWNICAWKSGRHIVHLGLHKKVFGFPFFNENTFWKLTNSYLFYPCL